MAKDRFLKCEYYESKGVCSKGRDASFFKYCQKCNLYSPVKGSIPAKKDLRRHKKEEITKKEMRMA